MKDLIFNSIEKAKKLLRNKIEKESPRCSTCGQDICEAGNLCVACRYRII